MRSSHIPADNYRAAHVPAHGVPTSPAMLRDVQNPLDWSLALCQAMELVPEAVGSEAVVVEAKVPQAYPVVILKVVKVRSRLIRDLENEDGMRNRRRLSLGEVDFWIFRLRKMSGLKNADEKRNALIGPAGVGASGTVKWLNVIFRSSNIRKVILSV